LARLAARFDRDYFRVADHTLRIVLVSSAQPAGRFLVLEICGELDLSGNDTFDWLAKGRKRNGTCAEKRVDCGSAYMVEEVKELCD
jgi:hypothetical protein